MNMHWPSIIYILDVRHIFFGNDEKLMEAIIREFMKIILWYVDITFIVMLLWNVHVILPSLHKINFHPNECL